MKTDSLISSRRSSSVTLFAICFSIICLAMAPLTSVAQNTISTYAGGGAVPTSATALDLPGPTGAIRDAAGNTYIAAPYSTYVFKLTGSTVSTFAGLGYELYSGDGGLASKAGLDFPTGLAMDTKGNIYISDPGGSRIREVASNGKIQTVVGSGTKCEPSTATCGDGGKATASTVALNLPNAVAVDVLGIIYIADSADHRIRAVNTTSKVVTIAGVVIQPGNIATIAGNGNICSSPTNSCGDNTPATSAQLNFPEGIAVDSNGNIYIADTRDNRIREIASGSSNIIAFAGSGIACNSVASPSCGNGGPLLSAQFHLPMGLFIDPSNNLYVADSLDQEVRFINVSAPSIATVAGNGTEGFSGDAGLATAAELNLPGSVFLDNAGNLLISDTGNQRVRIVTTLNISTLAGGGTGGDGGVATSAIFANPYNVAVDSAGDLFIADSANNRVLLVNAKTGIVSTVAGNGNAGFSGDGGAATSATLNAPAAVAVDSLNNVWIADTGNSRIREVLATTSVISTVAGNGLACNPPPLKCGDGGLATNANISTPLGIAVDTAGNLYISDYTAQYVRVVSAKAGRSSRQLPGSAWLAAPEMGVTTTPAKSTKLDHPLGVAVDTSGNVYIDDSQNNRHSLGFGREWH